MAFLQTLFACHNSPVAGMGGGGTVKKISGISSALNNLLRELMRHLNGNCHERHVYKRSHLVFITFLAACEALTVDAKGRFAEHREN